ncbi:hypothetical protein EPUS_01615 [Endocarpon pusillum Z07020]|uniref:Uncharacterized protein n=1 Tax=Endocarpon pusillum (strain Z07020 / HMAS-L-300199) TaxID=1263415 RepID=U1HY61_ENDPU|nr:uncharacterized protein EPUS_01615 [Endocarpon pusillum Z07020]ERF75785.1 hypothetical protein EPUS_01615 [Endocarpon pusillum Z07020]
MTSLLGRFFTPPTRADPPQHDPLSQISVKAESTRRSRKRQPINARTRKSISSLFGLGIKVVPEEDRQVILKQTIATCQEAQHYPIYDPTNPEHDPGAVSTTSPQGSVSNKRGLSQSPTKAPRWKESPSPKRPTTSARARARLQVFADTLRAKANIFYEAHQQSFEEELMLHEVPVPPTPNSAKSICSKKSVRFRSGHSVIGNVHQHSSPISVPKKTPPSLLTVDIPSTPAFEINSDDEKSLRQTARTLEQLSLPVSSRSCPKHSNRPQLSLKVEEAIKCAPELPTPMPGTNLPLEDPFNDTAAALCSEQPTIRTPTISICSDQGYISDEESNAGIGIINTARARHPKMLTAQSKFDPSLGTKKSTEPVTSSLANDHAKLSSNKSPTAARRALSSTNDLPLIIQERSTILRPPSETQYDADAERSDGSEAQKEPPVPPLSQRVHSRKQHVSQNEADLLESASTSPLSISLSRRSSLGKPGILVESQQPGSQGWATDMQQPPDITQCLRVGSIPLQTRSLSNFSIISATETQSASAQHPELPEAIRMIEEAMEDHATAEHYPELTDSQIKLFTQPAHPNTQSQIPTPSLGVPARKQSSDESQETDETTGSTALSSTVSGSAARRSSSVALKDGLHVEHQRSTDEADFGDIAMFNKHQYIADTPRPLDASYADRSLSSADSHRNPSHLDDAEAEKISSGTG